MTQVKGRSQVFVTQEMSNLDYVPAEKFGEIVFLTRNQFSAVKGSLGNKQVMTSIQERLRNFDPETDYIVCSGSPTVAAAVFAIIGGKYSAFTVLQWSNRDNFYSPITLDLKG